jgi:hypothetical protein
MLDPATRTRSDPASGQQGGGKPEVVQQMAGPVDRRNHPVDLDEVKCVYGWTFRSRSSVPILTFD